MHVLLLQMDIQWRNPQANFDKVHALLKGRSTANALVVLPEMFSTGYDVQPLNFHGQEQNLGDTGRFLQQIALEYQCYLLGTGISQGSDNKFQNRVHLWNPQGIELLQYQKIHPFTFGNEHAHFSSGKFVACATVCEFQVAPTICYDLRFPEIFRHATLQGAEVLVVVANWPSSRREHWITLLQARAIENQCYVLGVNRVGLDRKLNYAGDSMIISPHGKILVQGYDQECVLAGELDHAALVEWRNNFPALQDIRPEFLGL